MVLLLVLVEHTLEEGAVRYFLVSDKWRVAVVTSLLIWRNHQALHISLGGYFIYVGLVVGVLLTLRRATSLCLGWLSVLVDKSASSTVVILPLVALIILIHLILVLLAPMALLLLLILHLLSSIFQIVLSERIQVKVTELAHVE